MSAEQAVSRVCDQCVQSRYPDDTLSGWTGSVGELRENLLLLLDAEQRQEMPHIPPNTVLTGRNVNLSVFAQIDISHIAGINYRGRLAVRLSCARTGDSHGNGRKRDP